MTYPTRMRIFLVLCAIECLAGALYYLAFPVDPKNIVLFGLSAARLGLVAVLCTAAVISLTGLVSLRSKPGRALLAVSQQPWIGILPPVYILLFSILAVALRFSPEILSRLIPMLAVSWIICVQYYLLLEVPGQAGFTKTGAAGESFTPKNHPGWRILLGMVLVYAFLLLPSNIPAKLDGLPWNTPLEFAAAAFLIPFILLTGRQFFSKRQVILLAAALLVLKAGLLVFTPASGLNVRLYRDDQGGQDWQRSYYSVLDPAVTDRMNFPYSGMLEFPLEWLNQPGLNPHRDLGFRLEFWGYGTLRPGEKLAFNVQHANWTDITWQDLATGETFQAGIQPGTPAGDSEPQTVTIESERFSVHGQIHFFDVRPYLFEALLIRQNGGEISAFSGGSLWRDASGVQLPMGAFTPLWLLAGLLDGLFMALVLYGIFEGVLKKIQSGSIQLLDAFLGATGAIFFVYAQSLPADPIEPLIPAAIALIALVRLLKMGFDEPHPGLQVEQVFIYSIGLPVLMFFLSLDFGQLKEIFLFPAGQDSLAYQMHARNIFVRGDFFMLQSPPHAYKLLYPYFVGGLHVLFGQSSAAQFFSNAWCAVLIAILLIKLLPGHTLPQGWLISTGAGLVFVYSLPAFFTFFYRFGLIEPLATLCMMLGLFSAHRQKWLAWLLVGVVGVLLRLDYIGVILPSFLFFNSRPMIGSFKTAWSGLFTFLHLHWKQLLAYSAVLILIPAGIITFFASTFPGYVLNASDTQHSGILSILEGWQRILLGGAMDELAERFARSPFETILLALTLSAGTMIALISLFLRRGALSRLDLRWGILTAGLLSVFIIVRPTGYSPRFSTPLLPLSLAALSLFIHFAWDSFKKYRASKSG